MDFIAVSTQVTCWHSLLGDSYLGNPAASLGLREHQPSVGKFSPLLSWETTKGVRA